MNSSKDRKLNISAIETIVFVTIWLILFSLPYLQGQSGNIVYWSKITEEWVRTFTYLALFLLNILFLVPKLLFPKKYFSYTILVTFSILLLNTASVGTLNYLKPGEPEGMPRMELGPGMPPMELGSKMPAPMGYRTPETETKPSLLIQFINGIIISVLVIGASIAFKMTSKWLSEESLRKDVEKEQLKSELAFLRHQISPHFFMNTLNNIHALVDINTEVAKAAVIRLSTLMRYLLYETNQGKTTLKKELEFIESYTELMKLRFTDKVQVLFEVPVSLPDVEIPPMLFISFLENAFKHGVSYQQQSYITFRLSITDKNIYTEILNSKHMTIQSADKKFSGIGLTNIRKMLDLHYDKDYTLDIRDTEKSYEIRLKIPVIVTGKVREIDNKQT